MQKYLTKVAVIALAYYLTGRFGLLLSIPPGFATIAWPPSGIALVAILIWGTRHWPGVFLGSFFINVFIAFDASSNQAIAQSTAIACGISAGASLQAIGSAYLIQKFIKMPTKLEQSRDIALFMLLAGPIGCLINASIGTTILYLYKLITIEQFLISWLTWWIGESIGAFVFAPILYLCLTPNQLISRHRQFMVTVPLIMLFAISITLFFNARNANQKKIQYEFETLAENKSDIFKQAMDKNIQLLQSMAAFYNASKDVTREMFTNYAAHIIKHNKSIKAIEWIPKVTHAERTVFENSLKQQGLADFTIKEKQSDKKLITAAKRTVYYPVAYLQPLLGNEDALGYDLNSETVRAAALKKATETGKQVATAPITLVQKSTTGPGFLVFHPIYHSPQFKNQNSHIRGFVLAVFSAEELVKNILQPSSNDQFTLQISDITDDNTIEVFKQEQQQTFHDSWSTIVSFGERIWLLNFSPSSNYLKKYNDWQVWTVLIGGLLLTGLMGSVLMTLTAGTEINRRLVRKKTDEIRETQDKLKLILDATAEGIYGLDMNGNTTFANKAAAKFVGYSVNEMIDKPHHALIHHSHADGTPYPQVECKIHSTFKTGITHHEHNEVFWRKDGTCFPVEYISSPTYDRLGKVNGVVVSFRDISARRNEEQERNELLKKIGKSNEDLERFAYIASHDLKAPLRAISHLSRWIEEDVDEHLQGNSRENFRLLRSRVKRMEKLLEDLLAYSRLGSSTDKPQSEIIDGEALINGITSLLAIPTGFQIKTSTNFKEITVNRMPLQQVLLNLIDNAIKHHNHSNGTVQIDVTEWERYYNFTVSDDGPGIPEEYQQEVFKMFKTLRPRDKVEGSGMGLAYVRKAVESYNGEIALTSEPGKGVSISFTWPRSYEEAAYEQQA